MKNRFGSEFKVQSYKLVEFLFFSLAEIAEDAEIFLSA